MFESIKFGTRIAVAVALLILPTLCIGYGMFPLEGGYPYWKNSLATGSCLVVLSFLGILNLRFFKTGSFLICGLALSLIGDFFMKQQNLIAGIGFFGVGHICFMLFFFTNGKLNRWTFATLGILLAIYIPYFYFAIRPGIAAASEAKQIAPMLLEGAVLFYLTVSILSLCAASMFNAPKWLRIMAMVGIACIVFSDTLIAEKMFADRTGLWLLMMPTYLATHWFITASAILDFVLYKNLPAVTKKS